MLKLFSSKFISLQRIKCFDNVLYLFKAMARMRHTRSMILSWVQMIWIQSFLSSRTQLALLFTLSLGRIDGVMPFLRVLVMWKQHCTGFKLTNSISYIDENYAVVTHQKGYWMRNKQDSGCKRNANLYNINKIQYLPAAWRK